MVEEETAAVKALQPNPNENIETNGAEEADGGIPQARQEDSESAGLFPLDCTQDVISLMDVYLADWMHRDNLFWKQAFAYFLAILAVSALPFINIWGVQNIPQNFPFWVFPSVGLVLSVLFFFVMWAYSERVKMSRDSYIALSRPFPDEYRPKRFDENTSGIKGFFRNQMAKVITSIMFVCLMAVSIASFINLPNPVLSLVSSCCT